MNKLINITPKALSTLRKIKIENNYKFFKFRVKGGGCNGFNYDLSPKSDIENKDYELVKFDDINVYVCNSSIFHLLGTEIDWEENVMGSNFIFNNPNAKSKCGCGTSFNID